MPNLMNENSSNSELVMGLIEVLEQEASLFETFLELLERQQRALVQNDLELLNSITEEQREKVILSGILNKKRLKLIDELTAQNSIAGDLTISKLIESVESGQATTLERLRETIQDLYEKIGNVKTQNAFLIQKSRENIIKTVELLGSIKTPKGNYQGKGNRGPQSNSLALDRRA